MSNEVNQFKFQGTLSRVDTFVTKTGKSIPSLVFETGGQWPQWIAIKCLGRQAEQVGEYGKGDVLSVTGRLGGRDYNGKIYPEVVAESVTVVSKGAAPAASQGELPQTADDLDLPF